MYYINLLEDKAVFLNGDEKAEKFISIFQTDSAEKMFANFHKIYVDTLVVDEDRDRVKAVMNVDNIYRVLKNSNSMSVNYRVRRDLLNPVYMEMRIFKAAEKNGKLVSVVLAFKLTDEELRNALEVQKKLKEDARVIGALSEDFSGVYYEELSDNRMDDKAVEVRASEIFKRELPEWEAEQSFTRKLDLLRERIVYEPNRPQFKEDTRREKITEKLRSSNTHIVNTRLVLEKEVRYYQIQFCAVRDRATVLGVVVGIRSVDEQTRKELEAKKQLQIALDAADAANRSKSSFLFNMSHDIRTPMNAIKGFTSMAKKYSEDTVKVRNYLDKIDVSGQQLLALINQVLEMSRIESGKVEFDEKPVRIFEMFKSILTVVEAQARAKGLEFCVNFGSVEHRNVYADDSRIGQILLNVLGNAVKYTPEGGRIDFTLCEIPTEKEGRAA